MPPAIDDERQQVDGASRSPDGRRSLSGVLQANFWLFFGSVFLLVGLPFVLLAGYFLVQERQLAAAGRVLQATVVTKHMSRSGSNVNRSVTYRFSDADGQTIEGRSDVGESLWSALIEGGAVDVAYLPNRPSVNRIVGTSKVTLLLIFAFVGAYLSVAGGTIAGAALRHGRMRRRLLTAGVRAPATVAGVKAMNLRVNGRTQWRLAYEYRDYQGQPHRRSMYLDGDEARRWQPGDTGEVLFDPDRPQRAIWLGRSETP